MFLTPYTHLEWAYQLHYHLCFFTHRRREFRAIELLSEVLERVYGLYNYHGLEMKLEPTNVQLLLSLKPEHAISTVLKKLKGESSNFLCRQLEITAPLWARGYLARTSGKVRLEAAQSYLDNQASHHGYDIRPLPPVFRFQDHNPAQLSVAHAVFDLKYHLDFSTSFRMCVFDSRLGEALVDEWLKAALTNNFALDRASVLPDHTHLIVRTTPNMSVEECALIVMNNGQQFVGTEWPARMIQAGISQLWQPSAYVGSCGDLPTALLKRFLSS